MAKTSEAAIELVSRCWCHPETENLNPNIDLSMIMAAKVDEMLALLAKAKMCFEEDRQAAHWIPEYEAWLKANHLEGK